MNELVKIMSEISHIMAEHTITSSWVYDHRGWHKIQDCCVILLDDNIIKIWSSKDDMYYEDPKHIFDIFDTNCFKNLREFAAQPCATEQ